MYIWVITSMDVLGGINHPVLCKPLLVVFQFDLFKQE